MARSNIWTKMFEHCETQVEYTAVRTDVWKQDWQFMAVADTLA
jgi:hypothetical protein